MDKSHDTYDACIQVEDLTKEELSALMTAGGNLIKNKGEKGNIFVTKHKGKLANYHIKPALK